MNQAPKQVVAGLIVREDKILVCQRTQHQAFPFKWEFPGGKIEANESPEEALRRELEEELGIRATIGRKVATVRHNYGNGSAVELHFFLVEEFEGELENRIFESILWAQRQELPTFDFLEADIALVKQISAGKIF
jgi:8-oxo-dGTP diphosphatase